MGAVWTSTFHPRRACLLGQHGCNVTDIDAGGDGTVCVNYMPLAQRSCRYLRDQNRGVVSMRKCISMHEKPQLALVRHSNSKLLSDCRDVACDPSCKHAGTTTNVRLSRPPPSC